MVNRDNYRAVKGFLRYQAEVIQCDPKTIAVQWSWLKHLLRWADETSFEKAHTLRPVFPRYLMTVESGRGKDGDGLAAKGIVRACTYARAFLEWHRRTCKAIDETWIDTLRPGRMADEPRKEHQAVTLEMLTAILSAQVPGDPLVAQRDKAAAAFLFLSGMRAKAFCTLPIGCVDVGSRTVMQYPTMGVQTKNRKAGLTRLLEIESLLEVVAVWDALVRARFPGTALWYPVMANDFGTGAVLTDSQPSQSRPINLRHQLFKLFDAAGLPRLSPHKFRHGHARYGLQQARDISDLKAVSMNLMHSSIGITDSIYAVLSDKDMQERIARLGQGQKAATPDGGMTADMAEIVRLVIEQMGPARLAEANFLPPTWPEPGADARPM